MQRTLRGTGQILVLWRVGVGRGRNHPSVRPEARLRGSSARHAGSQVGGIGLVSGSRRDGRIALTGGIGCHVTVGGDRSDGQTDPRLVGGIELEGRRQHAAHHQRELHHRLLIHRLEINANEREVPQPHLAPGLNSFAVGNDVPGPRVDHPYPSNQRLHATV